MAAWMFAVAFDKYERPWPISVFTGEDAEQRAKQYAQAHAFRRYRRTEPLDWDNEDEVGEFSALIIAEENRYVEAFVYVIRHNPDPVFDFNLPKEMRP